MSSSTVDQIKDRLSIVDVVSSYIKLDKAGQNFKACCPFHSEKTPSFVVSPGRGTYHCFGCGKGGDIFSFVEEIEGEDFRSVLEKLALRAGVQIEKKPLGEGNARLYKLLDDAARYFEVNLFRNQKVKDYLVSRGLIEKTIRDFRLGFSENSWNGLLNFLKKKGYAEADIISAGLAIKGDKGTYDRFRSRIMFPVSDTQGRVVGFSGRIFGETDGESAKYVNSPETSLYNKSRLLFGYDKAKQMIMKTSFAVVVEGQMDLLMSHQAGVTNSVAVSGTALTEEQLNLIRRFAEKIIFAFDADSAGIKAAHRSSEIALPLGFDIRFLDIPKGKDPADIIKEDVEEFHKAINSAPNIAEFYIKVLSDRERDERSFRLAIGRELLPLVALIENKIDQSHLIQIISGKSGIPETAIREELVKSIAETKFSSTEIDFKKSKAKDHLIGLMLWRKEDSNRASWEDYFEKNLDAKFDEVVSKYDDSRLQELIFEAEYTYASEHADIIARDLILSIKREQIEEKRAVLDKKIKELESLGDEEKSVEFIKEFQELSRKLEELRP